MLEHALARLLEEHVYLRRSDGDRRTSSTKLRRS